MAGIGGVVVNFSARTRDAVRDVDKFTKSLERSGKKAKSASSIIGNSLKFGLAGVGVAAVGAGIAFVDMAKAAYADAQQQAKLARTLKTVKGITDEAADATSSWIDKMELLTLVSDDDLRKALANLVLVTEDLTDAQKLTALAADAAVGSGRDFSAVATAMAKAAGGNTAALKRLFPFLDAGPDKVLTFEEAMSQLRDTYKGAAREAADNDLFGRLATAWGQIKEAVGQAALPSLEAVAAWFGDPANSDKVQEWIAKVGEWSRAIGEDFKGQIEGLIDYLNSADGQATMEGMANAAVELAGAIGKIAGAIETLVGSDAWEKFLQFLGIDSDAMEAKVRADRKRREAAYRKSLRDMDPYGSDSSTSPRAAPGGAYANSSGASVTVNITNNNPKPETASSSTAASLRAARNLTTGW